MRLLFFLVLAAAGPLAVAAESSPRIPLDASAEGDYPFAEVIRETTGHEVLAFDPRDSKHAELLARLKTAAAAAIRSARAVRIISARANEAGNAMEAHVLRALRAADLNAFRPKTSAGRSQAVGYPDVEIETEPPCYLELKTFNARTAGSSQRTFYFSPAGDTKITHDALHLLVAFEMEQRAEGNQSVWVPVRFKIISLHNLEVRLKIEYNQSNRGLYAVERILADERVE